MRNPRRKPISSRPQEEEDVQPTLNGRRHPRKRPPTSYQPKPGTLLQYGNYSLLRILNILNAAGSDGITTLALLDELGSRADRINAIIRKAKELGLIDRIPGESERGQFPPVYNIITERGKHVLQNHQLLC